MRTAALVGALGLSVIAAGCSSSGGGGATPPLPATSGTMGSSGNFAPLSSTTNPEDATITNALKTVELYGPIVALKTGGGFQMQAQSGIGYVNVTPTSTTHKFYNGLTPAANRYAIVTATGNIASSPQPVMISLYSTKPATVTITGTITSEQPYGVAVKLDSNGTYIPLGFNTLTNLTGSISTGVHVSATGTGTTGVLFPTAVKDTGTTSSSTTSSPPPSSTATPSPSPAPASGVAKHVMTAAVFWGYGGTPTTVSVTSAAPYLTWAQTGSGYYATLQSHGIKVDRYLNFWRNYSSDYDLALYNDIKPGGAHASDEAKNCSGTVLYDTSYGGGYEANALNVTGALGHAKLAGGPSGADAVFSDDSGAVGGMVPCNFSVASYATAVNSIDSQLGYPMFLNVLGAGASVLGQTAYAQASNVLGAMCELCITKNKSTGDVVMTGGSWTDPENAEIKMAQMHKIFWLYARASGAYTEYSIRMYTIASFLLAYDPNYAMLQEAFQTPSKFPIFPETGLVPMNPVTTASTVTGYARSGGAYMREFGACYYRGVNKGKCAVVVNAGTSSEPVPTTAYSHAMVLSGAGVLDGGTVSFTGSRPSSLASGTAAILFP